MLVEICEVAALNSQPPLATDIYTYTFKNVLFYPHIWFPIIVLFVVLFWHPTYGNFRQMCASSFELSNSISTSPNRTDDQNWDQICETEMSILISYWKCFWKLEVVKYEQKWRVEVPGKLANPIPRKLSGEFMCQQKPIHCHKAYIKKAIGHLYLAQLLDAVFSY